MRQVWHKAFGTLAVGLMLAAPATGCARPAPRPEIGAADARGTINPTLSAQAAETAAGIGGAGVVEAIVKGNVALVAIQLNSSAPGGAAGGPLTGKTHDVDYPGSSPSGGPVYLQGPGTSVGASPALPGGQISPGGATPGGTPNWTQAIPNGSGMNTMQTPGNAAPAGSPGSVGSAPMDVMTRIADQIKATHPAIQEVRFATTPEDASRVAELARTIRQGGQTASADADVAALIQRGTPAGTTEFTPNQPHQGTRGTTP